jgi:RNA polymerase sigma-70 factor (ECF subfamily)
MTNADTYLNDVGLAYPKLRNYAFYLEKRYEDAEDLLHDTIVRMIEKENRFFETSENRSVDLAAWGISMMHNMFVDKKRKEQRTNINKYYISEINHFDYPAAFEQPRDTIVKNKFKNIKEQLKKANNKKFYDLFILRSFGLSYKEISEFIEISEMNVKSGIHRMKKEISDIDINDTNIIPMTVCA